MIWQIRAKKEPEEEERTRWEDRERAVYTVEAMEDEIKERLNVKPRGVQRGA